MRRQALLARALAVKRHPSNFGPASMEVARATRQLADICDRQVAHPRPPVPVRRRGPPRASKRATPGVAERKSSLVLTPRSLSFRRYLIIIGHV